MNGRLEDRVARERAAHGEDDVLARSYVLKKRFSHILVTPGLKEMERVIEKLSSGMRGSRVLDFGCGKGEMVLSYLAAGARQVDGIDISATYVAEAQARCQSAGLEKTRFTVQVMDAHALDFPDESFDWVMGRGILHHLDQEKAVAEIRRVLKPGGQAVFMEPLADNPLLKVFRFLTPSARTVDERPIGKQEMAIYTRAFESESYFFGLFQAPVAMVTSLIIPSRPDNVFLRWAHGAEEIFRKRGWLNTWHQYVLLVLRKPA
ncbi:methyltransferase domain-containing protein [Rhodospirillum sp. A1_3_36]|uniref:class I SAM-dependent methyltransferase n=1 Tax=Rhodospirillum sp. A1_3_36 TaxID=3391666 RepID=UPI0039A6A8BA